MAEDDDAKVYPYPPWKRAIALFFEEGLKPGDTLTHEWLRNAFEIPMETKMTPVWEADRNRLLFITQLGAFKETMLRDHQLDIYTSERGVGYYVLHPREQTAAAQATAHAEIRKALRKQGLRLTHINTALLDHRERRENADALARFAMLRNLVRQAIEFRPDDDEETSNCSELQRSGAAGPG